MSLEAELNTRAEEKCELCNSTQSLSAMSVKGGEEDATGNILACSNCTTQFSSDTELDLNHWRCLNESAWSQTPAVQVVAWRMLNRLSNEAWAQDLLGMIYLDDETLAWAQAGSKNASGIIHKDSNGNVLEAGDTVTLIKDLKVKGAGFTAKRGTAVRRISLVQDNPEHIEGRVEGQHIVILTEFVKKSN